ncbi:MAG TPA: type II toxin-antitoxin system VapC family toxin [Gemmatimonadota bacterium]|nr:type II toxin-antitoxin system VapC family toxin [Gemmatimonadota bacterium]
MELTDLVGSGRVALDTVAFIYFIEEHPDFLPFLSPLLTEADQGRREIVTSAVTLIEVLVVPYRAGDLPLAERYEALLTRSRGVRLIDLDRGQLRAGAQLRATYGVRTPDALQLAAALTCRCGVFVTNDRRLPAIPGLRIVQLSDFLEAS